MGFRSRKFILAVMFTVTGCIGVLTGKVTGEHFYWLAAMVMGAYGFANVAAKKVEHDT